jgi:hypothetical protein
VNSHPRKERTASPWIKCTIGRRLIFEESGCVGRSAIFCLAHVFEDADVLRGAAGPRRVPRGDDMRMNPILVQISCEFPQEILVALAAVLESQQSNVGANRMQNSKGVKG